MRRNASTTSGSVSTRSSSGRLSGAFTRSGTRMTHEEEMQAIERESANQALRELRLPHRPARRVTEGSAAGHTWAAQHPAAAGRTQETQGATEQDGRQQQQAAPMAQSFDFEKLDDSESDPNGDIPMVLDARLPDPYADTTLTRLQKASVELDPHHTLTFPFNRVLPKAAVFLRCRESHVFALPEQINSVSGHTGDCHAVAQVMAPCPQCLDDEASSEVFASRKCAFCMMVMPRLDSGRYVCLTQTCWFGKCHFMNGSEQAVAVWKEVWRQMGNRYLFVASSEEVLSYSNDLERASPENRGAYQYTV